VRIAIRKKDAKEAAMGKEQKGRPAQRNEEMAFEWGDFAAHQPIWLMEEQKQAKKKETKKEETSR
jgi:hypothetical protein